MSGDATALSLPISSRFIDDRHWKVVMAGSRFITPTESRYAPIEREALILVYGFESSRMFVLWRKMLMLTPNLQHQQEKATRVGVLVESVVVWIQKKKVCAVETMEKSLKNILREKHVLPKMKTFGSSQNNPANAQYFEGRFHQYFCCS